LFSLARYDVFSPVFVVTPINSYGTFALTLRLNAQHRETTMEARGFFLNSIADNS